MTQLWANKSLIHVILLAILFVKLFVLLFVILLAILVYHHGPNHFSVYY
jgi:hypothetical protein